MGFKAPPRSLDPTSIVNKPWNSLVCLVTNTLVVNVPSVTTIGHLQRYVVESYKLIAGTEVKIKVISCQIWVSALTTAGTVSAPKVHGQFFDLGTGNIRSQQTDSGALGRPARIGYVWPVSDSKEVYGTADAANTVVAAETDSTAGVTNNKHIQFLWNVETPLVSLDTLSID